MNSITLLVSALIIAFMLIPVFYLVRGVYLFLPTIVDHYLIHRRAAKRWGSLYRDGRKSYLHKLKRQKEVNDINL